MTIYLSKLKFPHYLLTSFADVAPQQEASLARVVCCFLFSEWKPPFSRFTSKVPFVVRAGSIRRGDPKPYPSNSFVPLRDRKTWWVVNKPILFWSTYMLWDTSEPKERKESQVHCERDGWIYCYREVCVAPSREEVRSYVVGTLKCSLLDSHPNCARDTLALSCKSRQTTR